MFLDGLVQPPTSGDRIDIWQKLWVNHISTLKGQNRAKDLLPPQKKQLTWLHRKKLPFLLGDTIDTSSFMFFFFSQSCYPRVALCIGFFFKADQWGSTLPDTASLPLNIGRGGSLFRSRRSYMKCLEEVAALVVAQDVNTFWGGIWTPNISWEGFQGFQTPPYQVCQGQKSLKMGMVIQPPNRNPFFMGIQTPTIR